VAKDSVRLCWLARAQLSSRLNTDDFDLIVEQSEDVDAKKVPHVLQFHMDHWGQLLANPNGVFTGRAFVRNARQEELATIVTSIGKPKNVVWQLSDCSSRDHIISSSQFIQYCRTGIKDMIKHKRLVHPYSRYWQSIMILAALCFAKRLE